MMTSIEKKELKKAANALLDHQMATVYMKAKSWAEFRLLLFMELGYNVSWWKVRGYWLDTHNAILTWGPVSILGAMPILGLVAFEVLGVNSILLSVIAAVLAFTTWQCLMIDAWREQIKIVQKLKLHRYNGGINIDFASLYPSLISPVLP